MTQDSSETNLPPLRIVVLARDQRSKVQTALVRLETFLKGQSGIVIEEIATTKDLDSETCKADLAIVLGGDGSILHACRQFDMNQIPMLGINKGRLGFLTDASPEEFELSFDVIRRRQYTITEHLMFVCVYHPAGSDQTEVHLGLNEVTIRAGRSLSMIDVQLSIDDKPVTTYSGDGVIVSTPVGSTAHSLSAGGPILRQDLQAFVVTPICPHTLSIRPIVDSANCVYRMVVPDAPEGVTAVVDGQIQIPIASGDVIEVRQAPVKFQLARLPSHSFYTTLQRKLGWDGQPNYRTPDGRG